MALLISLTAAGTGQPGPPCVADFDGDGQAEIAWASSSLFNMFELDGSVLWTRSVTDASGLAACSGYDIDGDGAYEVYLQTSTHSMFLTVQQALCDLASLDTPLAPFSSFR